MQASKSRDDLERFDTFRCLNCQTTIIESQRSAPTDENDRDSQE